MLAQAYLGLYYGNGTKPGTTGMGFSKWKFTSRKYVGRS